MYATDKTAKPLTGDNLKQYYLNILAKKDYSKFQLKNKALQRGYTLEVIEDVIKHLVELNFVNDLRLAENIWENYKSRKGKIWIQQKMQIYGIPSDIIKEVLTDQEEEADFKLRDLVAKKYKIDNWQSLDPLIKQKILSFLAHRGFSKSWEIIKNWQEDT